MIDYVQNPEQPEVWNGRRTAFVYWHSRLGGTGNRLGVMRSEVLPIELEPGQSLAEVPGLEEEFGRLLNPGVILGQHSWSAASLHTEADAKMFKARLHIAAESPLPPQAQAGGQS